MTTENLIELFEKGLEHGLYFKADTQPFVGRYMEFGFDVRQETNKSKRLGVISIVCEFDHVDYYDNNLDKSSFGVFYYIKYNSEIQEIKPFKFSISQEIFLKLLKQFRPFERADASRKSIEKQTEFTNKINTIGEEFNIEVSALQRMVLTEKAKIIYG